jgi:hypothetical protein
MGATWMLLAGTAVFVAAGDLAGRFVAPRLRETASGRLGLALVLGPGLVAFLATMLNVAGIPFSVPLSYGLGGAVLVAWLATARAEATRVPRALPSPPWSAGESVLVAMIAIAVALGVAFAVASAPYKDSIVNWSLKTLVLWQDGSILSEDLRGIDRHLYHPNYPYLVPVAEVFLYGLAGSVEDRTAKAFLSLGHLGTALLLVAWLTPRLGRRGALALAVLAVATPQFFGADSLYRMAGSVPSGYADPQFAALALLAAIAMLDHVATRSRGDIVTSALALGLAIFTKNEALPFAILLAVAFAVALALDRRRVRDSRLRDLLVAALACAAIAIPWLLLRSTFPERDENYQHLLTRERLAHFAYRLPTIGIFAIETIFLAEAFALLWPLLLIVLATRPRRILEPAAAALLVLLAGMSTVYLLVFVVTSLPITDSLVTSISRTALHLVPLATALLGVLLLPRDVLANEPTGESGE